MNDKRHMNPSLSDYAKAVRAEQEAVRDEAKAKAAIAEAQAAHDASQDRIKEAIQERYSAARALVNRSFPERPSPDHQDLVVQCNRLADAVLADWALKAREF